MKGFSKLWINNSTSVKKGKGFNKVNLYLNTAKLE